MNKTSKEVWFITFVVSLGGFLFGFDAGIISGVMTYVDPQFDLNSIQSGWAVSSPTFSAMFAMLIAGKLSNKLGRKKILIIVAFLYVLSALASAYAPTYTLLWIARMVGGLAFGAALILVPTYIAEISIPEDRGKLVSIQQLNIVFGFFAAFLCNYYLNDFYTSGGSFLIEETVWRWMLAVEFVPAVFYFGLLFFIPKSPRWLLLKNRLEESNQVLHRLHGPKEAQITFEIIKKNIVKENNKKKGRFWDLLKPKLRFVFLVGLTIGVLQQITGINAIYFYATSIFEQTGIGTNAAFASGIFLSLTTIIFTIAAILLIDKLGRRPLLLYGLAGIAISLLVCFYGFNKASYSLTKQDIESFSGFDQSQLNQIAGKTFDSDIEFKKAMIGALGARNYAKNEGDILQLAGNMNAILILAGILGFTACFAFSLGPVMWVLLSEMYPNKYRGLAIGFIGFVNSFASWMVQQVFPWELSTFGNANTFLIFGLIAVFGFIILYRILPETKGKSLEDIESQLTT